MIRQYLHKIDSIKSILIILIVCLHSSLYTFVEPNSISSEVYRFLNVIFDCAVPTFMFLSCYLFFRNFSLRKYKEKVLSRVRSLVIPYFAWNTILYLCYLIFSLMPATKGYINAHSFSVAFESFVSGVFLGQACPQLWFLRVLFLFAIASPVFYIICKKCNKYVVSFIVIITTLACVCLNVSYTSALFWIPLYLYSAYFTMAKNNYNIFLHNNKNTIVLFLLFIMTIIASYFVGNSYSVVYYVYRLVSPLFVMYFLDLLVPSKPINKKCDSFFIYCVHLAIIEVVRKILILTIGIEWHYVIYPLTILLCLMFASIIGGFLKIITPNFYNVLMGGRLSGEKR